MYTKKTQFCSFNNGNQDGRISLEKILMILYPPKLDKLGLNNNRPSTDT